MRICSCNLFHSRVHNVYNLHAHPYYYNIEMRYTFVVVFSLHEPLSSYFWSIKLKTNQNRSIAPSIRAFRSECVCMLLFLWESERILKVIRLNERIPFIMSNRLQEQCTTYACIFYLITSIKCRHHLSSHTLIEAISFHRVYEIGFSLLHVSVFDVRCCSFLLALGFCLLSLASASASNVIYWLRSI